MYTDNATVERSYKSIQNIPVITFQQIKLIVTRNLYSNVEQANNRKTHNIYIHALYRTIDVFILLYYY